MNVTAPNSANVYVPSSSARKPIPLDIIQSFGQSGIDLNEERIYTSMVASLAQQKATPILAKEYLDPEKAGPPIDKNFLLGITYIPVKVTYAEACEYVIRMINHLAARNDKDPRLNANQKRTIFFSNATPNDWLYSVLTSLYDHNVNKNTRFEEDRPIKWFLVICNILKDKGYIQEVRSTDSWSYGGYQITLPL